ncbi:MAG: TetR/AcrR family transcriptional regulator [Gemmatimonadaceae bacterium]|nr:TetR/AcrR family transcriptional regulator [Gemmatimonadaceae bacterium]
MTQPVADEHPRERRAPVQRRGRERVETILDAAEAVISEVGLEAATTNAIAERAGSSVGSLYHFFPNKQAIVDGLLERYLGQTLGVMASARRLAEPWVPLTELFEGMIRAFLALDETNPAYFAVCRATDVTTGQRSPAALEMNAHMEAMVVELLRARNPRMPAGDAHVHASISVTAVHAVLDHLQSMPSAQRGPVQRELVQMMVRYFEPIEAHWRAVP